MAPSSENARHEVIYMTPDGPRTMHFVTLASDDVCEAARQLRATHWVCQDGYDHAQQMPIWALFELKKCDPSGGGPGRWAMAMPTKTWTLPNVDFLWMWARHMHAAGKL